MRRFLLILSIVISVSACTKSPTLKLAGMPRGPKEGPPEYLQGWQDGCRTGMTAYSNSYMRTIYSARFDGDMMSDPNYNKGWRLGNRYCNYYVSSYLSRGWYDGDHMLYKKTDLRSSDAWKKTDDQGFDLFRGFFTPGSGGSAKSTDDLGDKPFDLTHEGFF